MTEHKKLTRVYGANLCTFAVERGKTEKKSPIALRPKRRLKNTQEIFPGILPCANPLYRMVVIWE
ncbi:hypothetical protein [Proteus phage P16-2532]|nr:hypothetical protein [Proteus phage P16-2532]